MFYYNVSFENVSIYIRNIDNCFFRVVCFKLVKVFFFSFRLGVLRMEVKVRLFFEFISRFKYEKKIFFINIRICIEKYSLFFYCSCFRFFF